MCFHHFNTVGFIIHRMGSFRKDDKTRVITLKIEICVGAIAFLNNCVLRSTAHQVKNRKLKELKNDEF